MFMMSWNEKRIEEESRKDNKMSIWGTRPSFGFWWSILTVLSSSKVAIVGQINGLQVTIGVATWPWYRISLGIICCPFWEPLCPSCRSISEAALGTKKTLRHQKTASRPRRLMRASKGGLASQRMNLWRHKNYSISS